jgi:cyclohexanone monooxygenase
MMEEVWDLDALVVGAGIAGLYSLYKLRSLGLKARAAEMGDGVGGTWFWNRYPGARCDTESVQYSYSFDDKLQEEWCWSERFAAQPEILKYLDHVADRHDLRRDIDFSTEIASAHYDEAANTWTARSKDGKVYRVRFMIMASGCLTAAPSMPDIKGLRDFKGEVYYTARWPTTEVTFGGKKVAVMGTGSSGIQVIPEIAKRAEHLRVFQRTPNYSLPARNTPMPQEHAEYWRKNYKELREKARHLGTLFDFGTQGAMEVDDETRERIYQERWERGGANFMVSFNDLIRNDKSNETAADFVRRQIKQMVKDPEVAEKLTPYHYPIFSKRICIDTDYFDTYNRDNVDLTDLQSEPIRRVTANAIETEKGSYEVDMIVFATGFDAMTGPLTRVDIRGRDGMSLKQKWQDGPYTYLGIMSAGFPNLFMITGPGSPAVLGNMAVNIEQHVEWIADCLIHMREKGVERIDADVGAELEWVKHVADTANATVYPRAASWYMGANIPGKPRVFLPYIGGVGKYREIATEVANDGYRGFRFD